MASLRVSSLEKKTKAALRKMSRKVVDDHKKANLPLIVWKDGKVVRVSAKSVKLSLR